MNVTIKGISSRLHRKLKSQAETNRRSLNREVIEILQRSVESQPVDVEALLSEVARVRARIGGPPLTEEFLRKAKDDGRP